MLAVFYTLNKRKNSLKTPTTADITISGEVLLKQSTSIHTPVFIMAVGSGDINIAMNTNYCVWNNTCYWVNDVIMTTNNHMEFTCKEDVLATYKNEILLTTAYIVRSSNLGSHMITDDMIKVQANCIRKESVIDLENDLFTRNLRLQVGFLNNAQGDNYLGQPVSMISYYQLDNDQMKNLKSDLCEPTVLDQLMQYFSGDVMSCMVSAQFTPAYISTSSVGIKMNDIVLPTAEGRLISKNDARVDKTYTLEYKCEYTDFRGRAPYTQVFLHLPFIGIVTLDTAQLFGYTTLNIDVHLDRIQGGIIYEIWTNDNLIGVYSGSCNSDTVIARNTNNVNGILSGAIQMGVGAVMLGIPGVGAIGALGAAASIAHGAQSGIEGIKTTTQTSGAQSTSVGAQADLNIRLLTFSSGTSCSTVELTEKYGNPCGKPYLISTLTGYCQTSGASVSIAASEEEINEVNTLLDRGVYIE